MDSADAMPRAARSTAAGRVAFWAAAGLCALSLAMPAAADTGRKPRLQVTTETDAAGYRVRPDALGGQSPVVDMGRFAFTAPGRAAPPRLATTGRSFRFTPSGSADRKALALGVTSRVVGPAPQSGGAPQRAAAAPIDPTVAPAGYNVDLMAEWKGFALSGGVMRLDEGLTGGRREGVDVGLGYRASRWRAGLQASAERASPGGIGPLGAGPLLIDRARLERRYAFEASGAYALSPGISVLAGARYRVSPVNPTLIEPVGDDRAVFVGGSLAF